MGYPTVVWVFFLCEGECFHWGFFGCLDLELSYFFSICCVSEIEILYDFDDFFAFVLWALKFLKDGELPVLPLSVYGAVAMAHNPTSEDYSAPSQFFFYLYDKRSV